MNKYQEAINDIDGVKMLIKVVLVECEFIEDLYNEELDTLRKLLDKATPNKVNMENMHYICCPNCHSDEVEFYDYDHNVVKLNYCNRCGQALDWSKDE